MGKKCNMTFVHYNKSYMYVTRETINRELSPGTRLEVKNLNSTEKDINFNRKKTTNDKSHICSVIGSAI